MAGAQTEAQAVSPIAEAQTVQTLGLIFSVAAGVGLAGMESWSKAAQKVAPFLESPSLLSAAINSALAMSQAVELVRQEAKSRLEVIPKIAERIAELRDYAAESGEAFSESSDAAFRRFLSHVALTRRPSIFLGDDGELSAVWDNSDGELLSLQFSGDGAIRYIALRKRDDSTILDKSSGVGDAAEVLALLPNFRRLIA